MEKALAKVLKIVEETGEHAIVVNSNGEQGFVVMTLAEFQALKKVTGQIVSSAPSVAPSKEALANLSEEQLLNKINHEIAEWKNAQFSENLGLALEKTARNAANQANSTPEIAKISEKKSEEPKAGTGEERFYFEPVDDAR